MILAEAQSRSGEPSVLLMNMLLAKLQLTERASSTTKLCLAVTNPRISVAQPSLSGSASVNAMGLLETCKKQAMRWFVPLDIVRHISRKLKLHKISVVYRLQTAISEERYCQQLPLTMVDLVKLFRTYQSLA